MVGLDVGLVLVLAVALGLVVALALGIVLGLVVGIALKLTVDRERQRVEKVLSRVSKRSTAASVATATAPSPLFPCRRFLLPPIDRKMQR